MDSASAAYDTKLLPLGRRRRRRRRRRYLQVEDVLLLVHPHRGREKVVLEEPGERAAEELPRQGRQWVPPRADALCLEVLVVGRRRVVHARARPPPASVPRRRSCLSELKQGGHHTTDAAVLGAPVSGRWPRRQTCVYATQSGSSSGRSAQHA